MLYTYITSMQEILKSLTSKKLKLDQYRPLPKEVEQSLEDWLRVELTYSSNAIEGNTLTRLETAEILEKGIAAIVSAKSLKDQLEAINHSNALDLVTSLTKQRKTHQHVTQSDILAIHKLILTGIMDQWAGIYRQSEVFVRGANVSFPLPQSVPYAMDEFIEWLETAQGTHPVLVAAEAHFKLVSIHPFVDGNGRTARLLMNLILAINGYPMAVIRNEDRTAYLEAVNKGQTQKDLTTYYELVAKAVERSLAAYIAAAQGKPALRSLMPQKKLTALLKIGEFARQANETIHTIRFWTKQGLLEVADYTEGRYQLYDPAQIDRARKIRQLADKERLTLNEIREKLQKAA